MTARPDSAPPEPLSAVPPRLHRRGHAFSVFVLVALVVCVVLLASCFSGVL